MCQYSIALAVVSGPHECILVIIIRPHRPPRDNSHLGAKHGVHRYRSPWPSCPVQCCTPFTLHLMAEKVLASIRRSTGCWKSSRSDGMHLQVACHNLGQNIARNCHRPALLPRTHYQRRHSARRRVVTMVLTESAPFATGTRAPDFTVCVLVCACQAAEQIPPIDTLTWVCAAARAAYG